MNNKLNLEAEPFEAYSEFDETFEVFDSEIIDEEWEEESRRRRQMPVRPTRVSLRTKPSQRRPIRPFSPIKPWLNKPRHLPRRVVAGPSVIFREPTSKPPATEGSEYIRWVQSSLNQVLGLQLPIDGIISPETRSAIRSFQEKQGLPVDGIIGPPTEKALTEASNDQSSKAEESEVFGAELVDEAWEGEVKRSSPRYIRWIQQSLNKIMGISLAVDGIMGHQTRSAIRRFQQQQGLKVDGIVGPTTEAALKAANAMSTTTIGTSPLPMLTAAEQAEFDRLSPEAKTQFTQLQKNIGIYTGVALREANRGNRILLQRGVYRGLTRLLPEILNLTRILTLPSGWSIRVALPLLVGNVLYNLAFPETINQGGYDRLGGKPDPTCFSASTQILLARRYPATYVRLVIQLAATNQATFAGGDSIGPLTFLSTSLYKSLDSVLLQTAFDQYFTKKAIVNGNYMPGDELKVHRQVFGTLRPPRLVTYAAKNSRIVAFRKAFVTKGGNTRPWEIINLCTGISASPNTCGNHSVVLTRVTGGRVYFYNPWANEEERNTMFGTAVVTISGHGERPAESSMTLADFENQITAVFHN